MLLAVVTFYVGVYNLLIFFRRPKDREYLTLAASCIFFSMYDVFCALLYGVSTSAEGGQWQRWQGVALALATASFAWFVFDYLEESAGFPARARTVIAIISSAFLLNAVLLTVERSGLYWIMDRPLVKTIRLPFGATVVYNEVTPGPLSNLQSLIGFAAYAYVFALIVRVYRAGAKKLARPLIIVMSFFFIAMVNDTAVSGGWYSFVYIIEYAYMVMVLNVTNSLTMKVVQSAVAREALQASDARFRGFVESSKDWIWEVDARGTITYSSPNIFDLLGYAPGEAVGKSAADFVSPDQSKELRQRLNAAETSPAPAERIEYECLRKDGGSVFVETNVIPLVDPRGACTGYRGIARDVTGRKAAEGELRKHARQLAALRQLGMEITAELDLDSLLRSVVSRALGLLEAGSGGMYFHDPERGVIEWRIGVGPIQPPPDSFLGKGEGLPGRVWERGETLVVREPPSWGGTGGGAEDAPNLASMAAPVRWGGEFFGVLYIIGGPAREFGAGEANLLDLFASQAAVSIRNARLFEEAKSRAERLSVVNRIASAVGAALSLDELLEIVYRETLALFAPDAFFIALYDEKSGEIELRFRMDEGIRIPAERVPAGGGLASRVIAGKKPLLIPDVQREKGGVEAGSRDRGQMLRTWLGVPMLLGDRVVGVISVQSYKTGAYGEDDAELLSTVAGQISAAVERARLYQTLRDSEEKHRTLFEQAMDAIILQGADGTILDANERACRLLGYSRDELLRLNAADIAAPGLPLGAESGAESPASGRRMEGEYLTRDGARVPVEASIALLTVAGKPVVSIVAHDITMRRRVEEQLRQAQKMEAVGALAGGVAHDFNNILTSILGYATLLRQEVPVGSQLYEDVEAVAGSARRAAELTQQLRTFSRRTPQDEMKPVDLHDIIREVKSLLARTIDKSIVVETALEARLHTVEGISGQLHQALLNLCLNARDAMPMGGRVRIRTRTSAPLHGSRGKAGRLSLSVSDTGTGMTQEVRDHLFEPFFTTKQSGRGLGLAMVYGIVRGHGGQIVVQSSPGAGSTFEIDLPLTRRSAKKEAGAGENPSRHRGSETVLVVDDEKTVRGVLTRILERNGYTVVLAEDGAEGVEKYRENGNAVDLVILDIAMPRMNGNEAYGALMEINPKLKVLVSSGYSEEDRVMDLIGRGANGFLRKPYESETVLAAVREVLDS